MSIGPLVDTLIRQIQCLLLLVVAATGGLAASERVVIKGSDTLGARVVPLLAEAFKDRLEQEGRTVSFEIAAEGSSTGVAATIDGTADIGMSSRSPNNREFLLAETKGVAMTPIQVAKDSIAIIVSDRNPVNGFSLREVEAIFTGDINNWAGLTDFGSDISAYIRNTSSGTHRAFRTLAMQRRDYGSGTMKMASNEQIASQVAANAYGVGYVGLAYVEVRGVKVLSVDGFMPRDGNDYPLTRPLYFLIDRNRKLSPTAREFIEFTLSSEGQRIIRRAHYLPIQ